MLRNCTAVITGSTSGSGLGLAEAFAAAGYRLVINGIATPEKPSHSFIVLNCSTRLKSFITLPILLILNNAPRSSTTHSSISVPSIFSSTTPASNT